MGGFEFLSIIPIGITKIFVNFFKITTSTIWSNIALPKVGLNEKQLAYIEAFLSDQFLILKEKEATAYLFRRNLATILHILGFTTAQIHYIIGHEIEDNYETRNEFVDDHRLYEIKSKMERRPILGMASTVETSISEHMTIANSDCSGMVIASNRIFPKGKYFRINDHS